VETARKIKRKQFILDGEAVVLGVDGISNFDDLHSRQYDEEVQLYALDILAYEGRRPDTPAAAFAEDQPGPATAANARRGTLPYDQRGALATHALPRGTFAAHSD
jgi:hypothetical protein